jgi:hypothetical protein
VASPAASPEAASPAAGAAAGAAAPGDGLLQTAGRKYHPTAGRKHRLTTGRKHLFPILPERKRISNIENKRKRKNFVKDREEKIIFSEQ